MIAAGQARGVEFPTEVLATGWLGYPGATEEQLAAAEARLGRRLPPSYRAFLSVTNGWRQTGPFIDRLWATEEIEWFAVRHQDWIDAYTGPHAGLDPLPDEEYFVYGEAQDSVAFRPEHLRSALEVSDVGDAAILLLNPEVVTPEGEWEAWFFANWKPGAERFRSFWELMQAEYRRFQALEAHDAKRLRKQEPLSQLPAKLPGLVDELRERARFYRQAASRGWGPTRAYEQAIAQGLESVAERVRQLEAEALEPRVLLMELRALAEATERQHQALHRGARRGSPLGTLVNLTRTATGLNRTEGLRQAAGILRWFLAEATTK